MFDNAYDYDWWIDMKLDAINDALNSTKTLTVTDLYAFLADNPDFENKMSCLIDKEFGLWHIVTALPNGQVFVEEVARSTTIYKQTKCLDGNVIVEIVNPPEIL